jgi:hypothetical protein
VAEHVNDLAGDRQCQLTERCTNFVGYSIPNDESTDIKDTAGLSVFILCVNEDDEFMGFFELVPMDVKTGADEIFSQLVTLLNKSELLWRKMVGFVGDGALAITGKNNGIAAKLKNKMKESEGVTSFLNFHYVLYQQVMCAESFKMNHTVDTDIKP